MAAKSLTWAGFIWLLAVVVWNVLPSLIPEDRIVGIRFAGVRLPRPAMQALTYALSFIYFCVLWGWIAVLGLSLYRWARRK
jgi:hypothetical protein